MPDLTKDSDKVLCCIYKQYLEKRKNGKTKDIAKSFSSNFYLSEKKLASFQEDDIYDSLLELKRAKYIRLDMLGNFDILDSLIIRMENRFKDGLKEVLEIISTFT